MEKEVKTEFFSPEKVRRRIFKHTEGLPTDIPSCFLSPQRAVQKQEVRYKKYFLIGKKIFNRRALCLWGSLNVPEGAYIGQLTFQKAIHIESIIPGPESESNQAQK